MLLRNGGRMLAVRDGVMLKGLRCKRSNIYLQPLLEACDEAGGRLNDS